jgi:membrane fusion protein, multidrug efflux system
MPQLRAQILLVAVTCALAATACGRSHSGAKLPELVSGPRSVRTVLPVRDHASDRIKATGTTSPLSSTKVMPLVPGLIISLPVKEGDLFKRGQVLATLDQRGFKLQLRQAEAAIAAAKVAVDATTREKARFQQLLKDDATAKAQFDQVMDRFRGAEAQMNQALVARDMARKALNDTVIRAPYDGVVVKKIASVGDFASSMPPTVLLSLMDVHALELKISLPEPEMQRVAVGAQVTATIASLSNRSVTASIARIIRSVDPMTRSFDVIAELPNPGYVLKPGLFVDVEIATGRPRQRLLLPSSAVIDEGAGVFSVFMVKDGSARRVEVRVAAADQERLEVLGGLGADQAVIADPSGLLDGDPVKLEQSGTPSSSLATGAAAR